MFDIFFLARRFVDFIKRYPRTWTVIGFLIFFAIGIWVGKVVPLKKVPEYVKSYTDPIKSDETEQVFPGVVHRQILDDGVLTNVLSVKPDAVEIRPFSALGAAIGTEYLQSIALRNRAPIAINGGYYEMSGTFKGESVGALKIGGEWISEPEQGRGVVAFNDKNGKIETYIDRISLQHEIVLSDGTIVEIDGINRGRTRNELVLYRPHFHNTTLTMHDGVEIVVKNDKVTKIYDRQGSSQIPNDGYILSANGRKRQVLLDHIVLGDSINIREYVIPERVGASNLWEKFTHIIGGGPLLIRNGVIATTEAYDREGFDAPFHSFWHPRTAVGKKADGTLLFVTITGADPKVRRGVKLDKLARLFQKWGATDAVNLDGGSSSMMVIRNKIVSIKRKPPPGPTSEEKPKPAPTEKETDKTKLTTPDKQGDVIAKNITTEKKTDANAKTDSEKKQVEEKTVLDRRTMSARGNRRVRPMPRFQGRAISDAILIYPRNPNHSR